MKIETYEVEEMKSSDATTMAADSEAIEIATRCGLTGQLKLAQPETATRLPYRKMTALEALVYGIVLPRKTLVSDYEDGIIPLRVLQVVSFLKENKFFQTIEVWHPEPGKVDPLLVGIQTIEGWRREPYLLARWGESLEPFAHLAVRAKATWKAKCKAELNKIQSEVSMDLARLDDIADISFLTGKEHSVVYSGF